MSRKLAATIVILGRFLISGDQQLYAFRYVPQANDRRNGAWDIGDRLNVCHLIPMAVLVELQYIFRMQRNWGEDEEKLYRNANLIENTWGFPWRRFVAPLYRRHDPGP